MKRIGMMLAVGFALAATGWADTGMPAFDELQIDVAQNIGICKQLNLTEDQRENILDMIEEQSETLIDLRDALDESKAQLELAKEEGTPAEIKLARMEVHLAESDLSEARDTAFKQLKPLVTKSQYKALKKWREDGNNGTR